MIFWLIPVVIGVVFLSWFLVRLLKQYDMDALSAAFERISTLKRRLDGLQERLETIEAIESDAILDAGEGKEMSDSAESLSSGRKPLIE
jgi:hypothetical protein